MEHTIHPPQHPLLSVISSSSYVDEQKKRKEKKKRGDGLRLTSERYPMLLCSFESYEVNCIGEKVYD